MCITVLKSAVFLIYASYPKSSFVCIDVEFNKTFVEELIILKLKKVYLKYISFVLQHIKTKL